MNHKTKQKQEQKYLSLYKVNGGYIVRETYAIIKEDDNRPEFVPYVCSNIDQVLELVDKLLK